MNTDETRIMIAVVVGNIAIVGIACSLIGTAVYWTQSSWPLWALLLVPSMLMRTSHGETKGNPKEGTQQEGTRADQVHPEDWGKG